MFGANPMNDSTVTLNGTAVTFAASPSAGQVQMGSTLAATLQNLIAALEAFADANIMLMEYFANASNLYVEALAGGAAGNAFTIAASTSPASGGTTSGTTLANGSLTELVTERGKELSWPSPRLSCTHCATSARCPSRKHSRYREKPRRRDALFLTLPAKPNEAIGQRRPAGVAKTAHADG